MIRRIAVKNFKAFRHLGPVDLSPLVVLAGRNSSGKSSLIHSLLILKQAGTMGAASRLGLTGPYWDFGSFTDVVFGVPDDDSGSIHYCLELQLPLTDGIEKAFGHDCTKDAGSGAYCRVEFCFEQQAAGGRRNVIGVREFRIESSWGTLDDRKTLGPSMVLRKTDAGYAYGVGSTGLSSCAERSDIADAEWINFIPVHLWRTASRSVHDRDLSLITHFEPVINEILSLLRMEIFERIDALGPLREPPQFEYTRRRRPVDEGVGARGEHAAEILLLHGEDHVEFRQGPGFEAEKQPLSDAVNIIRKRLGLNQTLKTHDVSEHHFQLLLSLYGKHGGKHVPINETGFGNSHLLPIIIMGLRSEKNSILLIEQPEIQLHPAAQANLADFFLSLALEGRRVIIESHSDHLIHRLRALIAEDPTGELKKLITILFVKEPDAQSDQGATIEELRLNDYGNIDNWPPDFMPEASDEAARIVQAAVDKHKHLRQFHAGESNDTT